jgi:hypothetical protein
MVTKSISLATAIVTLDVCLRSRLFSNDPLFLFISSGLAVNALLIILAGASVFLSFQKKFDSWYSYAACAALAAIFIGAGFLGVFYSDYIHSLWSAMLPLDYILMMQAGIVFGICALSYDHASLPALVKDRLPKLPAMPKLTLAFPVPKTLHPPTFLARKTHLPTP